MDKATLRPVRVADLATFYDHQRDPEAAHLAAFTPRDKESFMAHWTKIISNPRVKVRTILVQGKVAGNVVSWSQAGQQEIGYWLGREYWGQGIATAALQAFLNQLQIRPLVAHVAEHNRGSIRVLEKCGFEFWKEGEGMATPDGELVGELVLRLRGSDL